VASAVEGPLINNFNFFHAALKFLIPIKQLNSIPRFQNCREAQLFLHSLLESFLELDSEFFLELLSFNIKLYFAEEDSSFPPLGPLSDQLNSVSKPRIVKVVVEESVLSVLIAIHFSSLGFIISSLLQK